MRVGAWTSVATNAGVQVKVSPIRRPEEIEFEGHTLIAKGHAKLAEAAQLRCVHTSPLGDWIRVDSLPIPKRTALAACRSGELRAVKRGRLWLTTRADADAFLSSVKPAPAANDGTNTDDEVRASLGLVRKVAR